MDGSYYVNNMTNVKEVVNRVTVAESDGPYKYKITYQIFIGFDNNLANPQAGPYGYIQLMSFTPGEDTTGYENAKKIIQDSVRELWKDNCVSYHFARNGIMQKMYT